MPRYHLLTSVTTAVAAPLRDDRREIDGASAARPGDAASDAGHAVPQSLNPRRQSISLAVAVLRAATLSITLLTAAGCQCCRCTDHVSCVIDWGVDHAVPFDCLYCSRLDVTRINRPGGWQCCRACCPNPPPCPGGIFAHRWNPPPEPAADAGLQSPPTYPGPAAGPPLPLLPPAGPTPGLERPEPLFPMLETDPAQPPLDPPAVQQLRYDRPAAASGTAAASAPAGRSRLGAAPAASALEAPPTSPPRNAGRETATGSRPSASPSVADAPSGAAVLRLQPDTLFGN